MDWDLALTRNREALLRLLAMLFAAAGVVAGGTVAVLPRHVRRAILSILRPAESAVRRLIVIEARGLSVSPPVARPFPATPIPPRKAGAGRALSFRLFDSLKRFSPPRLRRVAGPGPRISVIGWDEPVFVETPVCADDDPVSSARLCRRMHALQRALDDLPKQARRLARWRARRAQRKTGRLTPLRPGWPPGHRKRPTREVDEVLSDCHVLARLALEPPDTS